MSHVYSSSSSSSAPSLYCSSGVIVVPINCYSYYYYYYYYYYYDDDDDYQHEHLVTGVVRFLDGSLASSVEFPPSASPSSFEVSSSSSDILGCALTETKRGLIWWGGEGRE